MDRETVITHLQIINTWAEFAREYDLQFFTAKHLKDIEAWSKDAVDLLEKYAELEERHKILVDKCDDMYALLKEQKTVKPVRDEQTGRLWLCGNCGSYVGFEDNDPHDPNEFDKYCRECGRPVLWEGR